MIFVSSVPLGSEPRARCIRETMLFTFALMFAVTRFSCEEVEAPKQYIGGKDVTPPSVTIVSPRNGERVRSMLLISFKTYDDGGIDRVVVTTGAHQVLGTPYPDSGDHYTFQLDVSQLSGSYTFLINSYDQEENVGRDSVTVNIQPVVMRVVIPGVQNIGCSIRSICPSSRSTIWFTSNYGLIRYASGTYDVNPPGFNPYRPDLTSMAIDSRGSVWVAYDELYSAGAVRKLLSYDGAGQLTTYTYPSPPRLISSFYSFAFDQSDSLWGLWYESGSYGYFAMKNGGWQSTYFPYGTPSVLGMAVDIDNQKLFAMTSEVRMLSGNTWTVFNSANSSLPAGYPRGIIRDRAGKVWVSIAIGSSSITLARYDNGVWTAFNGYPSDAEVFDFDQSGNVWLAGGGYLWKYNGGTMLRRYLIESANSIYCDEDANIWIGTEYGIYRVNENGL